MNHTRVRLFFLGVVTLVSGQFDVSSASAQEPDPAPKSAGWPQFRGPDGQGHVTGPIPLTWSDSDNVKWSTTIPGKGWSSPVILDGKVWLTTAVATPTKDQSLRVLGLDTESGKILHDIELFKVVQPKPKTLHERNSFSSPTPVLEKGRIYIHFGTYGNACVDTATGADPLEKQHTPGRS